jgi:hypothetical protein
LALGYYFALSCLTLSYSSYPFYLSVSDNRFSSQIQLL